MMMIIDFNKFDNLSNKLVDKEVLIGELEALNQILTVKKRDMENELQKA